MRKLLLASAAAGALLASACVATPDGEPVASAPASTASTTRFPGPPVAGAIGSELYGPGVTVRAEIQGDTNTLTFRPDGTVSNLVHSTNQTVQGHWWVANNQLCIHWQGASRNECWPYPRALQAGQTVTLTSNRGNTTRITMLSGSAASAACGTYGMVDRNNNGFIEANEWNAYRTGAYGFWDADRDGRVDRNEFMNCWQAGGFYPTDAYNRDYWTHYWSAFDANNDGWLSADEYWGAEAWTRLDRNRNGILDSDEWRWW